MSDSPVPADLVPAIARDLSLAPHRVAAAVSLFAGGNTVPFVARYRKEATGGLDEVALRAIEERLAYRTELEKRRATVLASIAEQGKLDPALEARIRACDDRTALEDLYLPFKPKRRTRASIARERGLLPLAERI
ncbi:MAG: RNA-binding transcriptional accessory protein, partial [Deltaproteobacteria bacterium]|nr:RNA-binding transcriptional accessory protein [Deltaproteobacteria bacterium]